MQQRHHAYNQAPWRTNYDFVRDSLFKFCCVWGSGGNGELHLVTNGGRASIAFKSFLGHPHSPHTPPPVPGAHQHPYYRVRPRHRGQAAKEKLRQRAKHFQEKQRQEQEAAASPLPPQPPSSISSTISSCTSSVLPPSSPPPQPPTPPASSVPCVPQPGAPPMASPSLSIPALTPNSPSTPFYGFPTPQAPSSRDRKKRPPLSSHHFPHSLESPHFLLHLRKWLGPRTGNLWQWKIILYFCSFCICA